MNQKTLSGRLIGFIASLILTLTAFFIVVHPEFHLGTQGTIIIIFVLAILQFVVQSIFFLNLLSEEGPRWNLSVFLSTLSIIVIIVLGSIWIMNHLNYNMMPM